MTKAWQLSEWKKLREEKLDKKCYQCGSEKDLVIHHHKGKYRPNDYPNYLSLKDTITLCKKCHFLLHKRGFVLCERCKKRYHSIRYKQCFECGKELGIVEPMEVEWCARYNTDALHAWIEDCDFQEKFSKAMMGDTEDLNFYEKTIEEAMEKEKEFKKREEYYNPCQDCFFLTIKIEYVAK